MIEKNLIDGTVTAFKDLFDADIAADTVQVQTTKKEFDGDLTLVMFPLLRFSGKNPVETGEAVGKYLVDKQEHVASYNVVKGFLNLEIAASYWSSAFKSIAFSEDYGQAAQSGMKYMVEYSSPNTNKPLHLGHLRNIFLGYSVSEILKANGHDVIKTQIINDRGIHICKSMLAWQKFGNGETPESSGLKGDKLVGKYYVEFDKHYKEEIAQLVSDGMDQEEAEKKAPSLIEAQKMLKEWEEGKPEVVELWKTMNGWVYEGFDATYNTMGVDFDKLYYESDTYLLGKDIVQQGLDKGVFYKKDDGSVWADLTDEGLDHKLVLRKDGTAVYMTQDIGTAISRFDDYKPLNGIIYTVGNEQDYHFKVLFLILKKLGYDNADNCFHLSYGMVDLPSGKMKSREGTVVDADDLMQEMIDKATQSSAEQGKLDGLSAEEVDSINKTVGLGALKYYLLKVEPSKRMMFNPEESIELQGHTGPFIQYVHARIASIFRRAEANKDATAPKELHDLEIALIKLMLDFPSIIAQAGKEYAPSLIANYAYDLAKAFNQFYQECPILKEEDEEKLQFRLSLCKSTGDIIKKSMKLLGIEVPNRM